MVASREQARAVTPLASAKGSRVSSSPWMMAESTTELTFVPPAMREPSSCRRPSVARLGRPGTRNSALWAAFARKFSSDICGEATALIFAITCSGARCQVVRVSAMPSGASSSAARREPARIGSSTWPSSGSRGVPPSSWAEARAPRSTDSEPVTSQPRRLAGWRCARAMKSEARSTASGTPGSSASGARGSVVKRPSADMATTIIHPTAPRSPMVWQNGVQ